MTFGWSEEPNQSFRGGGFDPHASRGVGSSSEALASFKSERTFGTRHINCDDTRFILDVLRRLPINGSHSPQRGTPWEGHSTRNDCLREGDKFGFHPLSGSPCAACLLGQLVKQIGVQQVVVPGNITVPEGR